MKGINQKRVDWGTWLSMAAIISVCVAITVKVIPPPMLATSAADETPQTAQATSGPQQPVEQAPTEEAASDAKADAKSEETALIDQLTGKPAPSGYRLSKPDATFALADDLAEVSGLSASKDPKVLWAVHDERGMIFRISTSDGSVLQEIEFSKAADYEGIEEVEGQIYVARSDGVVFVVDPKSGKSTELNFSDKLGAKCDLEGMGYEPAQKRILLACKGASDETRKSASKAFEVHAMDIGSRKLQPKPAFVLTAEAIDDYIKVHPDQAELKKVKGKSFGASGLSIHPQTGEINIISSMGEIVVVLSPKGAIVRIDSLDRATHPQPEGIAFGADGTLFVTNEARGKKALLHTFKLVSGAGS